MALRTRLFQALYGFLFVCVLPASLIAWARATEALVVLPAPSSQPLGIALSVGGGLLIIAGWLSLLVYGKGLPMNAFPPARFVAQGAYRIVAHPIYVGFSMMCFGVSIATGSRSGFWLVSPTVAAGCAALVLGYERQDLRARFGPASTRSWISLLPSDEMKPTLLERLSVYPLVLGLWAVIYESIAAAGIPSDAISTRLPFEAHVPVIESWEAVYAFTYPFVLLAPLVGPTRADLRRFSVRGLLAMALVFPLYLALPLISPEPPFSPHGFWGHLLEQERSLDTPAAAFPSFHVIWAFLARDVWASRFPKARTGLWLVAILIAVSCMMTGMHSLLDVVFGVLAYVLVVNFARVWALIRAWSERIANSWREFRVYGVRIINHGAYAALATFGAILIVGTILGPRHLLSIFLVALSSLVGAGLWAQWIEGSPALLRPYGWYGGLLGIILGSLGASLMGTDVFSMLAAYCVAGPWVQATGRLRCLVQGCCHGHEAPAAIGIRYVHPRSRVTRLSHLGGRPVHPTQVYSILWNGVIALVMLRLLSLRVPAHFLCGVYLILNGLGRFVEEAYRGEPQTKIALGLRLYQWAALASVVAGAVLTAVAKSLPLPALQPNLTSLPVAVVFAVLTGCAMGVDFPESNRRFSRLA